MIINIVFGVVICYLLVVANRLTKAILRMNSGYKAAMIVMAEKIDDLTKVVNYHTERVSEYEEMFAMEELELDEEFERVINGENFH